MCAAATAAQHLDITDDGPPDEHLLAADPSTPPEELDRLSRSADAGTLAAVASNPCTAEPTLRRLVDRITRVSVDLTDLPCRSLCDAEEVVVLDRLLRNSAVTDTMVQDITHYAQERVERDTRGAPFQRIAQAGSARMHGKPLL